MYTLVNVYHAAKMRPRLVICFYFVFCYSFISDWCVRDDLFLKLRKIHKRRPKTNLQRRHQNIFVGHRGGKIRFWGGKNSKKCRKWLILAIFFLLAGGGVAEPSTGGGGRAFNWGGANPPCPLDAATANVACFYRPIAIKLLIIVKMLKQHEKGNLIIIV